MDKDKTRVRALYGHSVPVNLHLECKIPPPILFHGTSEKVSAAIRMSGLLPMSRNFVHLSDDMQMAVESGKRHGKPLIVYVDTVKMVEAGYLEKTNPEHPNASNQKYRRNKKMNSHIFPIF